MTVQELSLLLKITPKVIRGYMKRNNVPYFKVGRSHRIITDPTYFFQFLDKVTTNDDRTSRI